MYCAIRALNVVRLRKIIVLLLLLLLVFPLRKIDIIVSSPTWKIQETFCTNLLLLSLLSLLPLLLLLL